MSGERPFQPASEGRRVALVLSGGGARGAYETGALSFVYGPLADRLGFTPRIDIYAGASVGAVHTCFLAAHSHLRDSGVEELVDVWRNMSFNSIYEFGLRDLFSFIRTLFGSVRGAQDQPSHGDRLTGLLNTAPLEKLVISRIPWRALRRNIRDGRFDALSVSTTEIGTGRSVIFVDNRERRVTSWTRDLHQVAVAHRISAKHALASAAIPLLFPAVRLGNTFYADGTLRSHTPLTSALRLGADRVLIIGLRANRVEKLGDPLAEERLEQFRSAGYLLGKALNAFLIDRLDREVAQMRVLNVALRAGLDAYGDEYLARINPQVAATRGLGFRVVRDCFVRPSRDIGQLASEHVRRLRADPNRSWVGSLAFRLFSSGSPDHEADLMSYLMFDGSYARDLIELGYQDARACEEQLAALFLD